MTADEIKRNTEAYFTPEEVDDIIQNSLLMDASDYVSHFAMPDFPSDNLVDCLSNIKEVSVVYDSAVQIGNDAWVVSGTDIDDAVLRCMERISAAINSSFEMQVAVDTDGTAACVPVFRSKSDDTLLSVDGVYQAIEHLISTEAVATLQFPGQEDRSCSLPITIEGVREALEGSVHDAQKFTDGVLYEICCNTYTEIAEAFGIPTATITLMNSNDYLREQLAENDFYGKSWQDYTSHTVKTEYLEQIETILADASCAYSVSFDKFTPQKEAKSKPIERD